MRAHEIDPLGEARGSRKLVRGQTDYPLVLVVEEPVAEVVQPRHVVGEPAAPISGEHDLRQQRLGCAPTASQHSREGERRSEEHTSELQSHHDLVCRLLLEKKKKAMLPWRTLPSIRP